MNPGPAGGHLTALIKSNSAPESHFQVSKRPGGPSSPGSLTFYTMTELHS